MRRNIRCHTDGNSIGPIDQEIWKSGWKNVRLLLRLIKVRGKINGILADICRHFHGNLTQPGLCITHGRSPVAVHGTEVSMTVHQRISGRPFLGKVDQGSINGTVSVGMIFSHRIPDDTRTFTMRLVRAVIQFDHGI